MKLIDLLLRLYPADFRARFGRDMRAFHDQRVQGRRAPWFRIAADHIVAALREQMHSLRPDLRYAVRGMLRRPAFTAVVVLTVAVGVGANAAIFSIVNGILLRPLPYPAADRLVTLSHDPPQWLVSEPQYAVYRSQLRSMESFAAFTTNEANISIGVESERVATAVVSREFFATLGVSPVMGRGFAPGEDEIRPANVIIISHGLWQRRFAGDARIVGSSITVNGLARTIIGVMPEGFEYPRAHIQLWLPICSQRNCTSLSALRPDTLDGWANHYLSVVARVTSGVDLARARQEAAGIARGIMRDHPQTFNQVYPLTPRLRTITDELVGTTRPYLVALLGAVGFLLLIVCANVANLFLARGEGRRREMALRTAIGASRRRLVTQVVTESIVFAVAGGALGVLLGWGGQQLLVAAAPSTLPRLDQIEMDWMIVAFSFAVALVAGLLFGIVPALRGSAESPAEALKVSGKGLGQASTRRSRTLLVIAEVALAMVLLSGAGMLTRSLLHLHRTDLGFRPGNALTAKVSPSGRAYDDDRTTLFYTQLIERLRAIPGVHAVGAARWLPIVDAGGLWDIRVEGKTYLPSQVPTAVPQEITPGFLPAMGMTLLAGRDFTDADRANAPLVAIVSRSFARRHWGDGNPIGRRFRMGARDSAWMSVVGVVPDIMARGPIDTPEPTMYVPHAQAARSSYFVARSMTVVMRTRGAAPERLATPLRDVVRSIDASVPVSSERTLDDVVGTATDNRRFSTMLIAGFAALALLVAAIGIYGVISYGVTERTFEIGVRMALGADRREVLALVIKGGLQMAGVGILVGAAGSALLSTGLRSILVGVPTMDIATWAGVAVLLVAVSVLASVVPARRASAVDPTNALRSGA